MIFILYICFIHPISIKKTVPEKCHPERYFRLYHREQFHDIFGTTDGCNEIQHFLRFAGAIHIYLLYIHIPQKPKCKQAKVVDDDDEEEVQKNMSTKQRNV